MSRCLALISIAVLAACSDDGAAGDPDAAGPTCRDGGGAACFQLPTAPMVLREGTAPAIGCGALVPTPSTEAVTYSGDVGRFGTGDPIAGADIAIYTSAAFSDPIATATSAADATYSIEFPAGTPDFVWSESTGPGMLPLYTHTYQADLSADRDDFNVRLFKPEDVESAAFRVQELWEPAYAAAAGNALDCDGFVIEHAAVTLSSAPGRREFVDGASVYYGAPGPVAIALPPEDRADTNDNGLFAIFRIPPGDSLVAQTWGFPDEAAMAQGEAGLVLVSEHPVHAVADSVLRLEMWANQ